MPSILHGQLVAVAAAWLLKQYPIVFTDIVTGAGETPDAIGFRCYESTLVECKSSRADFLRDAKKPHRQDAIRGMGNLRYYLTPVGLVKPEELPEGWGLLESDGRGKVRKRKTAEHRKPDRESEQMVLISALRRIGQKPGAGVSIRCYTTETERTATMGCNPYAWDGLPLYTDAGGINMSHPKAFDEINDSI